MVTEGEKQDLQRKLELKSDALTAYVKDDSEEITKLREELTCTIHAMKHKEKTIADQESQLHKNDEALKKL